MIIMDAWPADLSTRPVGLRCDHDGVEDARGPFGVGSGCRRAPEGPLK